MNERKDSRDVIATSGPGPGARFGSVLGGQPLGTTAAAKSRGRACRHRSLPRIEIDGTVWAMKRSYVKIYSQAAPAVANIVTRTLEYDVFMDPVPVEGAGSGFVIDPRGYILTNFHVVQGAQAISVTLGDRSHYDAKFIGADERNDIALIKIDPKDRKLAALTMGDSDNLQVGQRVLAIGNPFGFQSTLTTGVVSALGRTVQTGQTTVIDGAIQTDAAINQGNSGGPLLNSHGEVIGINSAIYTPSGTTAGIGFAIPISTAKQIAHDLITEGRVRRASMGVEARVLSPAVAEALHLPVNEGLMVERVNPGGPADKAGLHGGRPPGHSWHAQDSAGRRRHYRHRRAAGHGANGFQPGAQPEAPRRHGKGGVLPRRAKDGSAGDAERCRQVSVAGSETQRGVLWVAASQPAEKGFSCHSEARFLPKNLSVDCT